MEERDHHQLHRRAQNGSTQLAASERATEPAARSRWTPKPEQILILESIFNSGMVNPPKDETVRIRKLLEKFGAVGDANVFYWFQNRRSRSRRRQRQIQAATASAAATHNPLQLPLVPATASSGSAPGAFQLYEFGSSSTAGAGLLPSNCSSQSHQFSALQEPSCCGGVGASTSYGVVIGGGCDGAGVFSTACSQMVVSEVDQSPIYYSSDGSSMHCQTEFVSVFVNGVATEVPKGPFDAKAMFGESVVLVHSSGIPVLPPQSLQQGESYFLVSRHA